MGELYAAAYLWDASALQWQVHAAPQLWPLAHALAMLHLDGPAAPARPWAGNAVQADASLLAPLLATRCNGELAGEPAAPRGAALASLARAAWARGEAVDAALALPRYVRDKVAQTTAERQQHAGAPRP
jgi:tRNA threonylcarbamoyladenosine biosynthesis protein TsaB